MRIGMTEGGRRDLHALWDIGVVGSLSDSDLVRRFTDRDGAEADIAFTVLVDRHGPMVLGTCRRLLVEHHDAEDAFQATFLILFKKAKSLRVSDTLGPWLHEVARRVAIELRARAFRLRLKEDVGVDPDTLAAPVGSTGDLRALLDEELSRLPKKFREAVVLCDLEGLTIEVAARQLGWPFGTAKSRLARGRERLRIRLERRGLAPAVAVALPAGRFSAVVPTALRDITTRAALQLALPKMRVETIASAAVASLTEGVVKTMFLDKLGQAITAIATGTIAAAVGVGALIPATGAPPDSPRPGAVGEAPAGKADRALPAVITPSNAARLKPISRLYKDDLWMIVWDRHQGRVGVVVREQPVEIRDAVSLAPLKTIGEGKKIINFAFNPRRDTVAYTCVEKPMMTATILDLRDGATIDVDKHVGLSALAFSPDGAMLASGGYASPVKLWRVEGGQFVREFDTGPVEGGLTLEFSPDGRVLAIGNRNSTTQLIDVETGKLRAVLEKRSSHEIKFHPQGHTLAVAYVDGGVSLWRVSDGVQVRERKTETKELYSVDWSPDGTLLATSGRKGKITLWDPTDLSVISEFEAPESVVQAGFSPDGRRLYYLGGDGHARGRRWLEMLGVE